MGAIAHVKGTEVSKTSCLYLTKAWGKTDQQDFINAVIEIKTKLSPQVLLQEFQKIEVELGREKIEKWGPRIIDIDILLYSDIVVNQPHLTIPHPYLTQRSFVLVPLHELNPELVLPKLGKLADFIDPDATVKEIIKVF
ncbi:MAG: 2-amino-4-hydroxy-6-hydroxymethyldihydropteridine diphosphokinase [Proteobacteria bacterium]|nr:2-amino-4-hydroxy-6-hydroxymethyldihydropteridine diphosphokinase [Pseudomonadota bacterium]